MRSPDFFSCQISLKSPQMQKFFLIILESESPILKSGAKSMTLRLLRLRKVLIALLILSGIIFVYVEAVNLNSSKMNPRQKIIKAIYPAIMGLSRLFGARKKEKSNTKAIKPPLSFYTLTAIGNDRKEIRFEMFKGKKVLIVNT